MTSLIVLTFIRAYYWKSRLRRLPSLIDYICNLWKLISLTRDSSEEWGPWRTIRILIANIFPEFATFTSSSTPMPTPTTMSVPLNVSSPIKNLSPKLEPNAIPISLLCSWELTPRTTASLSPRQIIASSKRRFLPKKSGINKRESGLEIKRGNSWQPQWRSSVSGEKRRELKWISRIATRQGSTRSLEKLKHWDSGLRTSKWGERTTIEPTTTPWYLKEPPLISSVVANWPTSDTFIYILMVINAQKIQ